MENYLGRYVGSVETSIKDGSFKWNHENASGQMGQMAGQIDDLEAEANLKKTEAIISSMTPEERQNPDIIRGRRRNRIANGAGVSNTDVNRLLNQYKKMEKQMRTISRMFK